MADFSVHNIETAPAASLDNLKRAQRQMGFIPNSYGILSEAPAAVQAYDTIWNVLAKANLSQVEQQIVTITASVENGCNYCVAAHSWLGTMLKVPSNVLDAIRDGNPIDDPKLEALHRFTQVTVRERGWVSDTEVQAFLDAGYTRAHILEVLTIIAVKTLSNYANHLAKTPLDEEFKAHRWEPSRVG